MNPTKTKTKQAEKQILDDDILAEAMGDYYKPSKDIVKLRKLRKKRFEKMLKRKDKLGINEKCDRMDDLFTPHLTSLESADTVEIAFSDEFEEDNVIVEKARKSMPLAFQKITTAISVLIADNPKGTIKADEAKYKDLNEFIKNVYYENFRIQKKKRVLKKYTYHLAKYGLGYWREFIKKTYRRELVEAYNKITNEPVLDENGKIKWDSKIVYDIFDVVGENLHPHRVVLDDACIGVKDVNKPARDLFIYNYFDSKENFEETYPESEYPNAKYVGERDQWMLEDKTYRQGDSDDEDREKPMQVLEYENRTLGVKEIWAGDWVLLDVAPLPGNELSVNGDKWVFDKDDYDGIGVCQILELYNPLVDDIANASNEIVRMIVRPNEDFFNGAKISDESDDISYGAGNRRIIDGSKEDIQYSSPELKTGLINGELEGLRREIDLSTFITENLAGIDEAKTAYQSAQNREAALSKLSLPLGSIKDTIEDCANLDLKLYPLVYSQPMETVIVKKGDEDWDEALETYNKSTEKGIDDERVVVMEIDEMGEISALGRRKFKTMELPIAMEQKDNIPTGRVIETEELEYWEIVPKELNYRGTLEIEAKSFLPVSKVVEDEQDKATLAEVIKLQTTDEMGNPTLKDASGRPYTIDKVKAIKDYIAINDKFDPDDYVIPMSQENINNDNLGDNPLAPGGGISPRQQTGMERPELQKI